MLNNQRVSLTLGMGILWKIYPKNPLVVKGGNEKSDHLGKHVSLTSAFFGDFPASHA